MGNPLDNAIEAAGKCSTFGKIEIIMGVKKGTFVLVVKNPLKNVIKKIRQEIYYPLKEGMQSMDMG